MKNSNKAATTTATPTATKKAEETKPSFPIGADPKPKIATIHPFITPEGEVDVTDYSTKWDKTHTAKGLVDAILSKDKNTMQAEAVATLEYLQGIGKKFTINGENESVDSEEAIKRIENLNKGKGEANFKKYKEYYISLLEGKPLAKKPHSGLFQGKQILSALKDIEKVGTIA